MTTPIDAIKIIKDELARIDEARAKATQGKWNYEDQWIWKGPNSIANIRSFSVGVEKSERNGDFIAIAANEITKLTKALSVAVTVLEEISKYKPVGMNVYDVAEAAVKDSNESLTTIANILSGGKDGK